MLDVGLCTSLSIDMVWSDRLVQAIDHKRNNKTMLSVVAPLVAPPQLAPSVDGLEGFDKIKARRIPLHIQSIFAIFI